ncbi:hypothetical protein [Streptomyces sp. NPDC019507]|uniref:hypothetical protein n=1 Tax=Streptomyces sp. NPDC019507 TaxID=3154689 RepID=UPI0033FA8E8C
MTGFAVFMVLFGVAFVALGLADQRAIWWRFQARRHADPASAEPSEAGFLVQRLLCFAAAGLAFWGSWSSFQLGALSRPDRAGQAEVFERTVAVADWLDGSTMFPVLASDDGSWVERVDPELRGPERDDPTAVLVWRSSALDPKGNVEHYEVSSRDGTTCLKVAAVPSPEQPGPEGMSPSYFDVRADASEGSCTK